MYLNTFNIPLLAAILFLIGLCSGSFFNVVVGRWPHGISVVHPPSRCPKCNHGIRFYHNIPVLGWLILGGKCYDCKTPISKEYPIVEFITGILAASPCLWAWYTAEPKIDLEQVLLLSILLMVSVPVILIDIRHFLIPDILVWPTTFLVVMITLIPGNLNWHESLISGFASGFFLWLFGWLVSRLLKKDAMGFGDVQLIVLLGAIVGPQLAIMIPPFAAAFGLLGTLLMKFLPTSWRPQSGDPEIPAGSIPFGPYLCIGAIFTMLFGSNLMHWYLNLIMPTH